VCGPDRRERAERPRLISSFEASRPIPVPCGEGCRCFKYITEERSSQRC
jgi:hypothetical protein